MHTGHTTIHYTFMMDEDERFEKIIKTMNAPCHITIIFLINMLPSGPPSLLSRPKGVLWTIAWVIMFPMLVILTLCIPDFRRSGCWKHLMWLTLVMSAVFIGFTSYILIWMISVIGTFDLSSSTSFLVLWSSPCFLLINLSTYTSKSN